MRGRFAWIGNPETQCLSSCAAQSNGPNGNPGADAMVTVIAHSLFNAITDPEVTAYYDSAQCEIADKASTFTLPSASAYR